MSEARLLLLWRLFLILLCTIVFALRFGGGPDIENYAQHRNVGYAMDAVWGGHWLAQHDIEGRILSKPPLHTWIAGLFALVLGLDRLALALPSFLAVTGLVVLAFEAGRRRFGLAAGVWAGLAMALAPMMVKQITLIRSDALFALAIALAALAAWRAWETGRGWLGFWLAAGVAALVKGPLGLVLAAGGLLAWVWEKRGGHQPASLKGPHGLGVVLFLLVPLAWFVPAYLQMGQPLVDKMFLEELLGHAVGAEDERRWGESLLRPTAFFIGRFAPFSFLALYALWRVWRHPDGDAVSRRFERFLACWILAGLFLFSLASHQRADLLLPLWLPAALLAGRQVSQWLDHARARGRVRQAYGAAVGVHALLLIFVFVNYYHPFGDRGDNVEYAEQVKAAAAHFRSQGGDPNQLLHMDTPVSLQLYWRTHRPWLSKPEQQTLLCGGGGTPFLLATERSGPEKWGFSPPAFQVTPVFSDRPEGERTVLRVYRVEPVAGQARPAGC